MSDTVFCNPGNVTAGLCNPNVGSFQLGGDSVEWTDYGYTVAKWSAYTFLVAFGLATLLHAAIGIWKKHWWVLFTLAFGCAVEAIGWGGRVMSVQEMHWNENLGGFYEYDENSFIIQVVCLVIAPTLYSAANYIILGKLINATGGAFCAITPRAFAILFMFADFVCLVIQGAGGGIAGTAEDPDTADEGALIMTGGVIVQLVVTVIFVVFLLDFIRRFRSNKPYTRQYHPLPNFWFMKKRDTVDGSIPLNQYGNESTISTPNEGGKAEAGYIGAKPYGANQDISTRGVWTMVGMLLFTTLLIVIRSVYRSVELTDGWSGPIAVNQALFLGLDAFLMAILAWSYVFVHPAFFLPRQKL